MTKNTAGGLRLIVCAFGLHDQKRFIGHSYLQSLNNPSGCLSLIIASPGCVNFPIQLNFKQKETVINE